MFKCSAELEEQVCFINPPLSLPNNWLNGNTNTKILVLSFFFLLKGSQTAGARSKGFLLGKAVNEGHVENTAAVLSAESVSASLLLHSWQGQMFLVSF